MRVSIFIPCFMDQLHPETGFNMVKVLEKAGCRVEYNPKQTCCGQPAFNAGFWDEARCVAEKFLEDFDSQDYVVTPSASCAGFLRNYYPRLFENSALMRKVRDLGPRLKEFSEFLTAVIKQDDFGARLEGKVAYHDSCAALRECGIKQAPRQLLSKVQGLELLEMKDNETCCGFGGTFAVKFDNISVAMADQKIKNAMEAGADYIVSTDMSCLMHLDGCIAHNQHPLKTMHLADVLARGW